MRIIADDLDDAMVFISQTVAKENSRRNPRRMADWVFLKEESEDRFWIDFTGFDITF